MASVDLQWKRVILRLVHDLTRPKRSICARRLKDRLRNYVSLSIEGSCKGPNTTRTIGADLLPEFVSPVLCGNSRHFCNPISSGAVPVVRVDLHVENLARLQSDLIRDLLEEGHSLPYTRLLAPFWSEEEGGDGYKDGNHRHRSQQAPSPSAAEHLL
jgi:hypothetical protein